jgi:LPS-assembly protein
MGHVLITFKDIVVTTDTAEYDEETREGFMTGETRFSQGSQWLVCSRAEFNFNAQTGTFYEASGYTDRQFLVTGRTVLKTGPDTYRILAGTATTCPEERPKWSFSASATNIRIDGTARMRHTVFKIKTVPVFYFPYIVFPMEEKKRNSGLIPFHTGSSTSKGRSFREGYFQTLGNSADITVYGDYFSLRGLALGSIFRARPNPATRFSLEVYGIDDKLDQGGVLLAVDGESQLKDDWRAVARVNITSNFSFRQAFSDNFRSATVSQERAVAFLTRNHNSLSTNIAYQRDEVFFPAKPLVIRKIPSIEFLSLGTPLGQFPFILSFRASLEGLSRADSEMETQRLIQRLDAYPRLTLRIPSFKGFSLVPSVGIRETYYGARISSDAPSGIANQSLHRHYTDVSIELRTPAVERFFSSTRFGDFRHSIEPFATYRRIHGIKDLDKTVRFDEEDAIADTNEIEYGIVNRFFKDRETDAGTFEKYEVMAFSLVQKYYFDPTFGGAFRAGQTNSFYPLDTVSGFYQTGIMENLSPLSARLQLSPKAGIHSDFRADFDFRLQQWRNGSLSTLWQQGRFFLSGTYFRTLAVEPGLLDSNHLQGQVGFGEPDRGLSSSLTISYNLRTSQWLNSQMRVNYTWNCCGVAAEFNQFDLGLRTESKFSFSFTLKGIGSFGNLKRPDNLF